VLLRAKPVAASFYLLESTIDYCTSSGATVASKIPQKKKFSATKAVKSLARERVGTPKATRRAPDDKKKKTEKHKPTLAKLLSSSE
jgi:hypothetical protein